MEHLQHHGFFAKLDDWLCPADDSSPRMVCDGTYVMTTRLASELGFSEQDLEDILAVLQNHGGGCDCEILYNVSDSNRLKATYWQNRATGASIPATHPSIK